jgi:S-adenosylhomocysteine hydrolase
MQEVRKALLIGIERLQARVSSSSQSRTIRLAHQSMVQLGDANREFERQKLFHYLRIVADIQAPIQTANRLPPARLILPDTDP